MGWGIFFELTNACNLRCKTCLPASDHVRPGEISTEKIIRFSKEFFEAGADSIFLTGGEPFLHQDIEKIIYHLGKIGYNISIITNGYYLNDKFIQLFKKYNTTINVSLDGASPWTNDYVRGNGAFIKATACIEFLANKGIPVILSCTVSQQNFCELNQIALFAINNNCKRLLFSEVVKAGRAYVNWDILQLKQDEKEQLPIMVEEIAKNLFQDQYFVSDENCWVDGSNIYINSMGNSYLCSEIYQRKPELLISNVSTDEGIQETLKSFIVNTHAPCCYNVYSSEHVTLITNLERNCALI